MDARVAGILGEPGREARVVAAARAPGAPYWEAGDPGVCHLQRGSASVCVAFEL